ncbi:glycosyltransferase [Methylomonas methanica]|uniref:Glycosyl transferase family 2 n=1 Tax=Methylomonas methanica (strain DSM 25384 / MC09) TaxID=857087 RepID=F9ZWG8_METMM|nr:glycosyltransferase [Methylomonas methanica]AEF99637.1 glycosyl transferase family 2 [Methylomonas methanica MC09]
MTVPAISLIIPCYNSGKYLPSCIESILSQRGDFNIKEIIIVDDASTDDLTLRSLVNLQLSNLINVITNKGLKGAAGARNTGLRIAQSEWIIFLDADDVLTEDSIQNRIEALQEYPNCGWIGGDFVLWNEDGSLESSCFFKSRDKTFDALKSAFTENRLVCYPRPIHQFISVCLTQVGVSLIKRDLIIALGGFREHLRQAEDYQFWIRLAAISDFVFTPKPLMLYRQHGANTTAQDIPPRYWTIQAFEELRADESFVEYTHLIDDRLAEFNIENALYFRRKRNRQSALKSFYAAFRLRPNIGVLRSMLITALTG